MQALWCSHGKDRQYPFLLHVPPTQGSNRARFVGRHNETSQHLPQMQLSLSICIAPSAPPRSDGHAVLCAATSSPKSSSASPGSQQQASSEPKSIPWCTLQAVIPVPLHVPIAGTGCLPLGDSSIVEQRAVRAAIANPASQILLSKTNSFQETAKQGTGQHDFSKSHKNAFYGVKLSFTHTQVGKAHCKAFPTLQTQLSHLTFPPSPPQKKAKIIPSLWIQTSWQTRFQAQLFCPGRILQLLLFLLRSIPRG